MKKLWVLVALVSYSSYCYSEVFDTSTVYSQTPNAANDGYNWVMSNVLPQQSGLEVTNVIYQYNAIKKTEDAFKVTLSNKDNAGGYIFREVDDWTGKPGSRINKVLPMNNVIIDRWGDGSIETEGKGVVTDPNVVYTYQYDPCHDPQSNSGCPNYVPEIPEIPETPQPYDVTQDEYIMSFLNTQYMRDDEEEEENKKRSESEEDEEDLETALGAVNSALMTAEAELKANQLFALSIMPKKYTTLTMPGGEIHDNVVLVDKKLPDNKSARRLNLSQQLKHQKMVDSQYEQ
jgi:hypothetical protein